MTVFNRYGNAVKDPASQLAAAAVYAEGQVRDAASKISVASDGITSTHVLASLPSNARILPTSSAYFSALTGLTDYDIGLGRNGTVITGKGDVLVDGEDIHLAGSVNLLKNVATGSKTKRLWELAGYTNDPGGNIDIIGTVNAAASTTGSIESFVQFAK